MNIKPEEAANLVSMLPDEDQELACILLRKLVLAWDPHFTKVTPEEAERIVHAEASGFVDA